MVPMRPTVRVFGNSRLIASATSSIIERTGSGDPARSVEAVYGNADIDPNPGGAQMFGDAAENIELEIGEYNDRIQRAVDEANAATEGGKISWWGGGLLGQPDPPTFLV